MQPKFYAIFFALIVALTGSAPSLAMAFSNAGRVVHATAHAIKQAVPPAVLQRPADQQVCAASSSAAVVFSGTDIAYVQWVNNNTAIGLAAKGTGDIGSFIVTNTTASDIVATITATPYNSDNVAGSPVTFTITAQALPALKGATSLAAVCSGTAVSFTPAFNMAGATYTWTRNTVTGIDNAPASGSGPISEILVNNTSVATVTVQYNFVLTAPGGCTNTQIVTVPIKPSGSADQITASGVSVCNNVAAILTASSSVAGATYRWYSNPQLTGSPLATGATFTTPKLTANTSYYVTVQGTNVCENPPGAARKVDVTISTACGSLTPAGCSASGSLLTLEDFGGNAASDPNYSSTGLPAGTTTYAFAAGASKFPPQTNQYSLSKNPNGNGFSQWYTSLTDHTGNGYMAIFNADLAPGTFYADTLRNLCSGTKLFFSAWAISMFKNATGGISPNLTFILSNPVTGETLSTLFTGDIVNADKNWRQYGLNFTVPPGLSAVALSIRNNAPGGTGNDVALDDIGVYACLPPVTVTGLKAGGIYCPGETLSLTANYTDDGSLGTGFVYQWYYSATGDLHSWSSWSQIAGANTSVLSRPAATGYYRVVVGAPGNVAAGNFNCCAISNAAAVTVSAGPAVQPITGNSSACIGVASQLANNTPGGTWSSTNTAIATIDNTGKVTGISAGKATIQYTVAGTTGGCSTIVSTDVTVNPSPDVNAVADQASCADNAGTNSSIPVAFTGSLPGTVFNWSMDQGVGYSVNGSGNIPSFAYSMPSGSGPLVSKVTVTPVAGGCSGQPITYAYSLNPYPDVLVNGNDLSQCLNENKFVLNNKTNIAGNGPLQYQWQFDDGTTLNTADATHSFTTAGTHTYMLTATSAEGCSRSTTGNLVVLPAPSAAFNNVVISPNANDQYQFSVATPVTGASYYWDFGDGSTATGASASHAYPANGTYTVTLTVTTADGCNATASETIVVNKTPNVVAGFTINDGTQCVAGNSFVFTNTTATTGGITITAYAWDFGDGGTSAVASPTHVYANAGTYTVTLTVTTSTGFQDVVTQSVTVFATPSVVQPGTQTVCNGASTQAIHFNSATGAPIYNWTNNTPGIGLPASGIGDIGSFIATNAGVAPLTAVITVTPVENGCSGTPVNFTVVVNPTPNVSGYTAQQVCAGTTVPATQLTSNVAGAQFSWTNDNPGTGLAASGTGNIPAFTAVNTGTSPQNATIRIQPSANGCAGQAGSLIVTVNPVSVLTSSLVATGNCSGTTFTYTPTSSVAGTGYSWRRLAAAGIMEPVSSGTGNISEILTNSTTAPVQVQYEYTLSSPSGCVHNDTITVTINPIPNVTPPAALTACNGALLTVAPFASNINGVTFIWTNDNPNIGLAASGTGNIGGFVAANNTGAVITANISVIAVSDYVAIPGLGKAAPPVSGCISTPQNFTISVNPTPTIGRLSDTTLCPGVIATLPAFSGLPGTAFTWIIDKNIGLPLSSAGNLPAFTTINSTVSPVTATLTVTPSIKGCAGTPVASRITINPTVVPDFDINDGTQCLLGNTFTFTDRSLAGSNLSYTWDFGDGTSSGEISPTHTYTAAGTYPVKLVTGIAGSSCASMSTSKNVTVHPMPNPAFTYAVISPNTNTSFQFTSKSTITSGSISSYFWQFGDGSTSTLAQPQHTYLSAGTYAVQLTVTSNEGCTATISQQLVVATDPNLVAGFTVNAPVQCFNANNFVFTNTTTAVSGTTITGYRWDFGDGSAAVTSKDASHAYAAPGNYTVTLTATAANGYSDIVTQSVTVYATPAMNKPDNQVVCAGASTTTVRFQPVTAGLSFTWTNNHPEIGLAASGTGGTIPAFTAVNNTGAPVVATIAVTPGANSCTGAAQTFTITVNPSVQVNGFSDQVICAGTSTTPVIFTSNVTGASFAWTNDNTTSGLAASGTGSIAAFTGLNTGNVPAISRITVVPAANGCLGSAAAFTLTINPVPALTSNTQAGTICNGAPFHYTAATNVTGTSFIWTRAVVAGISNGGASGSGDPNETLINTTDHPVVVTYGYVLSAGGCTSAVYNVQVAVNPAPLLSSTLTPPAICQNTRFSYVPTSATAGTAFTWSRAADVYNPAATGTGNPLEILQNNGTTPLTVTYAYTLTASGCSGAVQNVQVIVNPQPADDFTANGPQCLNGNSFLFTLNPNSGAANYSWDFGDGNIVTGSNPAHSYGFEGLYPVTLTISSATGCSRTISHPVLVQPSPVAQFIYSSIAPNSNDEYQFTDHSIIGGGTLTTYSWDFGDGDISNLQNPTHAYAAAGNYTVTLTVTSALGCSATITELLVVNKDPNIIAGFTIDNTAKCITGNSFTFTNTSTTTGTTVIDSYSWDFGDSTPVSTTLNPTHTYSAAGAYVVRLTVTGHDGATTFSDVVTQSLEVFATPDMQLPSSQTVCNQTSTAPVLFKPVQPGLSFAWTMSADIGAGTSGTGNIAGFNVQNTGNTPLVTTVAVTPSANGCTGAAKTFTITVNPTPNAGGFADQVICAGQTITPINFTSNVTGTVLNWENNNTTTGIAASGTGNIPAVTGVNTGSTPAVSRITVTPAAAGCSGTAQTFTITVNPRPQLTSAVQAGTVCSGTTFRYTPVSNVTGTSFAWSRTAVAGISNPAASGTGDPSETLVNTGTTPITVNYIYTLTAAGCNGSATYNVEVSVDPTPVLTSATTAPSICSGTLFSYRPTSAIAGTSFTWTRATVAGISNAASSGTGNPAEILTNTTNAPVTVTYVYNLSAAGCSGMPQNVQVTVNPKPAPAFNSSSIAQCLSGNSFVFTNASTIGGGKTLTYKWDLDDGTTAVTQDVTHTYALDGVYTVNLRATSNDGCTDSVTRTVVVNPTPVADFVYNVTGNNADDQYQFTSTSVTSSGILTYQWDFGDGSTSTDPAPTHIYAASGNYTVTLIVTGTGGCSGTATHTIVVSKDPHVVPGFTVNAATQCFTGNNYIFTNTTTFLPGTVVNYTWNFGDGSTSTVKDPVHTYSQRGAYIVTLTATADRGITATVSQSMLVIPVPAVNPVSDQQVCAGQATAVVNFNGAVTSTAYNWTNDHPEIGLPANGSGNIQSFNGINTTGIPITATITVTPSSNGCTGPIQTFHVTIKPVPAVSMVTDQILCNGAGTTPVHFDSNVAGSTFSWQNSNTGIGLAASGTGDIASFAGVNQGYAVNSATISVHAGADGCAGPLQTFNIAVRPTPSLSSALAAVICDSAVFSYTPTSQVSGATFSWSRAAVTGIRNPAASGTGNPLEMLDNTTDLPVDVIYVFTVSADGCIQQQNVVVTVNPRPRLNTVAAPTLICSGAAFDFTPASNTPGTVITWNRNAVAGIANAPAFGTGNPNEALDNTTTTPVYVPYTFTLDAGGCLNNYNVGVTVSPAPVLSSSLQPTAICSGTTFNYQPASVIQGASFQWSRAAVPGVTNAPASGSGPVAEKLVTTVNNPVVVTYAFTTSYGNCSDTQRINVTVNPSPSVTTALPDIALCAGSTSAAITLAGPVNGTIYSWTNTASVIGLAGSGSGTIPAFTGQNPYNAPIEAAITVNAVTRAGCALATPVGYHITVNPSPSLQVLAPQGTRLCEGNPITLLASGGDTYQWYQNGDAISGANAPVLTVTQGGIYTVSAATSAGCAINQAGATTIQAVLKPIVSFTASGYCVGTPITFTSQSIIDGSGTVNYLWKDNAGHTSTATSPVFTYDQQGTYTIQLTVTPTACPLSGDSASSTLTLETAQTGIRLPYVNTVAGSPVQLHARSVGSASYQWSPVTGLSNPAIADPLATVSATQDYLIHMTVPSACVTTDSLLVRVLGTDSIFIPNAITPNGDGKNEYFVITGLDKYPGSELSIYNRWQNEVYHAADYHNDWQGTGLNPGTYYYLLKLRTSKGIKVYTGWILLEKRVP